MIEAYCFFCGLAKRQDQQTAVPSRSRVPRKDSSLDNAAIAELCAREAEQASSHLQQAFRRAARKAFLWPNEACDLVLGKRSLTELDGIGPIQSESVAVGKKGRYTNFSGHRRASLLAARLYGFLIGGCPVSGIP